MLVGNVHEKLAIFSFFFFKMQKKKKKHKPPTFNLCSTPQGQICLHELNFSWKNDFNSTESLLFVGLHIEYKQIRQMHFILKDMLFCGCVRAYSDMLDPAFVPSQQSKAPCSPDPALTPSVLWRVFLSMTHTNNDWWVTKLAGKCRFLFHSCV